MKGFARVTKLGNIGGRADYISNPERQEDIVAKSDSIDWKPYQEYERNNQRSTQKNNEGREVMIALPNSWAKLPEAELKARAQHLAETAVGKKTDLQWAIHWNKAHTNLHMHVIFSERQREELGKWDRDIYLTEDGKVARKKADRAKNPDGTFKPPVHRKGEEKGGFTAKDTRYKNRSWVVDMKASVKAEMERFGVRFDRNGYLHQFHEGKGSESPKIKIKNEIIRENNQRLSLLESKGMNVEKMRNTLVELIKDKKIPVLHIDGGKLAVTHFTMPEKALKFMQETKWHSEPNFQKYENRISGREQEAPEKTFVPETPSERKITQITMLKKEYDEQCNTLSTLQEQRKSLGFFKFKEKKKLDYAIQGFQSRIIEKADGLRKLGVSEPWRAEATIQELKTRIPQERAEMRKEREKAKPSLAMSMAEAKAQIRASRQENPIEHKEHEKTHGRGGRGGR